MEDCVPERRNNKVYNIPWLRVCSTTEHSRGAATIRGYYIMGQPQMETAINKWKCFY